MMQSGAIKRKSQHSVLFHQQAELKVFENIKLKYPFSIEMLYLDVT